MAAMIFFCVRGLSTYYFGRTQVNPIPEPTSLDLNGFAIPRTTVDLGTVWSGGQPVPAQFHLETHSAHEVEITSVRPDCSYTIPTAFDHRTEPNQQASIAVALSSTVQAQKKSQRFLGQLQDIYA